MERRKMAKKQIAGAAKGAEEKSRAGKGAGGRGKTRQPAPAGTKLSLKPIPPTLRGKKRYISFELRCAECHREKPERRFDETAVSRALWPEFLRIFGELGCAQRKVWLADWNPAKSRGILRCVHKAVDECIAGLQFLREIEGDAVIPKTLKVSGAIGKLKG